MPERQFPKENHPVNLTLTPGVQRIQLNPDINWTINLTCPNEMLERLEIASVSQELDELTTTLLPIEWPRAYRVSPDTPFDDRTLVIVVNRNTRHPFAMLSHCALDEEPVLENYCTIELTLLSVDDRGCGDEPGMMPCL
jgi:hypothetical protein